MTDGTARSMRDLLRSAIARAMKDRDRTALAAYRSALAAVDNAEAVPLQVSESAGAIERSVVGVGRTEAERRVLTEQESTDIVSREAAERGAAADTLVGASPEFARKLRRESELLQSLVEQVELGRGW